MGCFANDRDRPCKLVKGMKVNLFDVAPRLVYSIRCEVINWTQFVLLPYCKPLYWEPLRVKDLVNLLFRKRALQPILLSGFFCSDLIQLCIVLCNWSVSELRNQLGFQVLAGNHQLFFSECSGFHIFAENVGFSPNAHKPKAFDKLVVDLSIRPLHFRCNSFKKSETFST